MTHTLGTRASATKSYNLFHILHPKCYKILLFETVLFSQLAFEVLLFWVEIYFVLLEIIKEWLKTRITPKRVSIRIVHIFIIGHAPYPSRVRNKAELFID